MAMYATRDFIKGRQEIQKFYQGFLDSGVKAVKLETLELEEHGDTAYEVGRYTVFAAAGKTLNAGKYVLIWKREGGQWKYHPDIGVTSMPTR
jgi:ketosteroid isomerase-like protein